MIQILMMVFMIFGYETVCAQPVLRAPMEAFLQTATVLAVEDVGAGVSKPWKVTLGQKGQKVPAIFKWRDAERVRGAKFGSEVADEYADSYLHELAAYELDKLLGMHVLPVTIGRRVNGRAGALREWIDSVQPQFGHGQGPPDMMRMRDWRHLIWLFDYLIANVDRRTHNFLMLPNWTPILIDHSLAFATFKKPVRPLYRFPKEMIDRLQRVDESQMRKVMSPYLSAAQLDALLARRETVLRWVVARVEAVGEEKTFFSLENVRESH